MYLKYREMDWLLRGRRVYNQVKRLSETGKGNKDQNMNDVIKKIEETSLGKKMIIIDLKEQAQPLHYDKDRVFFDQF